MATSDTSQHLCVSSRVNQKVDYSKWARRSRKTPAKQKSNETAIWTNVDDPNATNDESTGSDRGLPPPSTATRRHQNSVGKSQPNTADGNALTSMPNGSPKKTNLEQEKTDLACQKRKDHNTKTLNLLVKSQRKAVKELESLCAFVQKRNQLIAQEIRDTDQSSLQSAEEFLDRHEKLGTSISAFNEWSQSQIAEAKHDLIEAEEESKRSLSALQKERSVLHARLANAQAELHTLKTYKDKEYPVKVLMISSLKREIEKLEETQQDEYEDLKQLCHSAKAKLAEQNLQNQHKVLITSVKENVSRVPHIIRHMAADNMAMKIEIKIYRKEIEKLEETNETLTRSLQGLKMARKNVKEEIFEDVFTKLDKCTADMDVILNIPKEDWLPI
ncbi:hypothetical protein ACEWY4_013606 [Coilia grayii]|uniref:Uncharacterized protein n=1 Tax=Coilia grayii TaxID=363190 RepID=A0ABD1JWT7_9TELE